MRVRSLLLAVSVIVAVYLGFIRYSDVRAVENVRSYGLWFIQAAFVIYMVALFMRLRAVRWHWPEEMTRGRTALHVVVFAVSLLVLYVHESVGFKVVMDELNLLGTSMTIHFDRQVSSPLRGYNLNGSFLLLGGFVDKRPYFFPFVVSLVHDLTGYRPANAFALNQALLPLAMGTAYALVARLAGFRAAILPVALLGTLPLLSQVAHGAGFELLNFLMILVVALHAVDYLDAPDSTRLTCLVYAGILLAQVRYESVLFVIPVGLIVLLGFWRERRVDLPWTVLLAPLMLIPYPWVYRVMNLNPRGWQLHDISEAEQVFGLQYLPANLGCLVDFMYAMNGPQPSSMVLGTVGLVGLLLYLVRELRRLPGLVQRPGKETAFLVMVLSVCGLAALLLLYFWGRYNDPVVRRLTLPLFFLLALPLPVACARAPRAPVMLGGLLGVALLGMYLQAVPVMARNEITQEYLPARVENWKASFLQSLPPGNYLFIDNPGLWLTHEQAAINYDRALERKRELKFNLMNHSFDDVFLVQRQGRLLEDGTMVGIQPKTIDPDFVLEPVRAQSFNGIIDLAIYRVKDLQGDYTFTDQELDVNPQEFEGEVRDVRMSKNNELLSRWAEFLP